MCFVLSLDGLDRCLGWMGGSVTDPGARINKNIPYPPHNSSQSHSTPEQIHAIVITRKTRN